MNRSGGGRGRGRARAATRGGGGGRGRGRGYGRVRAQAASDVVIAARRQFTDWLRNASGQRITATLPGGRGSTSNAIDRFIPISSSVRFIEGLRQARNEWNPSADARANLASLMAGGFTTRGRAGRTSFSIRKDPNPAALILNMLDYRLANEQNMSAEDRARRFTITIRGRDQQGQSQTIARSVDPKNVRQMLAIASAVVGGTSEKGGGEGYQMPLGTHDESMLESDPALYNFAFMSEISSIEVTALNPVEEVDEEGNVIFEGVGSGQPAPPVLGGGPRRSARIAARGGGAFFRYWLIETFPESLSIIQVYKKSETEKMVSDLSMKGKFSNDVLERYELSCMANSFILQGLPVEKYFILFQHTCSQDTPVFPTSRFGDLCRALRVNGVISLYSPDHVTRNRRRRVFSYGEEGDDKVYYVGKVSDHYVPDIDSGWSLSAIRNYMYFKEISGRVYYSLPLYKIKLLRAVKRRSENQAGISFRYADGEGDEFCTYGELLSVILWGHTQDHHSDGIYEQLPLVMPMTVENICLRAELYLHFQNMLKVIDLPTSYMDKEGLEKFVSENTRPICKHQRKILNRALDSADPTTWGNKFRIGGTTYSYELPRSLYSNFGVSQSREWDFRDRHVLDTGIKITKAGGVPPEIVYFSAPLPFSIIAFDTETVCIPESIVNGIGRYYDRYYKNSTVNSDHNDDTLTNRFNPYTIDSKLSREGIADFELNISDDDDNEEGKEKEEMRVHYPYCVSICYVYDNERKRPYNFREMDGFLNQKSTGVEEERCFGEEFLLKSAPRLSLVKKTFIGLDCMIQFCAYLGSSLFNDVSIQLIAHNARYDINMLVRYSFAVISGGIFRSASRMNCCELQIQSFPKKKYEDIFYHRSNEEGGSRESGKGIVYRRSNAWESTRVVHVQCTLATTGIPLSAFASTFRLHVSKEFMPYDLFTFEKLFLPPCSHYDPPTPNLFAYLDLEEEKVWKLSGASNEDEMIESVDAAGALIISYDGCSFRMKMWEYARYYCEMDCEVLLRGFLSLRKEMYQLQIPLPGQPKIVPEYSPYCELLLENAVSLPQFANHYFGLCGVFEGIHESKGVLMNFMRRGVTGGKTMLAANSPVIYDAFKTGSGMEDAIDDLDAVNLYPSAMKEIADKYGGFPRGEPKIWVPSPVNGQENGGGEPFLNYVPSFIARDAHYYFLLVRIRKLGRPLRFPIVNGPRDCFPTYSNPDDSIFKQFQEKSDQDTYFSSAEDVYQKLTSTCSSRHFTNHPEGARLVIDKFTFEDIIEFHRGAEVEVLQALYWDQGGTTAIGKVVEYLYASRLKLADEGKKAAAQARKLTMNSGYGRFLMGAPDSSHYFVEGRDNIKRYVARHSCTTKNAVLIRKDFAVVERRKGAQDFYNSSHLGAMVLSVSKRIMNRVMVLYEDMHEAEIFPEFRMFYMDTDSIHICKSHIVRLFKEYTERYRDRILVTPGVETEYSLPTKALGMFNTDFEPVKDNTPPVSVLFVGVMKKVYLDWMYSWNKSIPPNERNMSNVTESHHTRMKGVPTKCVTETAREENLSLKELYVHLLQGDMVSFDLAKFTTRFEMGKNFTVATNTSFKRNVRINPASLMIAHIEWVKNGFGFNTFPYFSSLSILFEEGKYAIPHYQKWFDWKKIYSMGKENFYYTCSNPNGVYLVTMGNLYEADRFSSLQSVLPSSLQTTTTAPSSSNLQIPNPLSPSPSSIDNSRYQFILPDPTPPTPTNPFSSYVFPPSTTASPVPISSTGSNSGQPLCLDFDIDFGIDDHNIDEEFSMLSPTMFDLFSEVTTTSSGESSTTTNPDGEDRGGGFFL